jgi:hypothetical protein
MSDWNPIFSMLGTFLFPLVGGVSLLATKLSCGVQQQTAERQFLVTLVIATMVTLHTVVICDDAWLVHTVTLAMMILGALVLPDQDTSVAM